MIRSSNDIIRDLLRYHVDFARDGLGIWHLPEREHIPSQEFIFHEDITGKEITQTHVFQFLGKGIADVAGNRRRNRQRCKHPRNKGRCCRLAVRSRNAHPVAFIE